MATLLGGHFCLKHYLDLKEIMTDKPERRNPAKPATRANERRTGASENRPEWQTRVSRPRRDDEEKSPLIPDEITENDLDMGVRVQLKTLTAENAEMTARHLAMVNLLHEADPELAHKHAKAAAKRAGRIAVVRETLGVTAYLVGDYALALRELTTYRRISGSNDQLPLMVDSERGLGRAERALELGRSVDRSKLPITVRVNLAIVLSGARLDLGQTELALAELEIPELNPAKAYEFSPALFRAYAETLILLKRVSEAKRWSDLADKAEIHFSGEVNPENEVFSVVEEIRIPEVSKPARQSRKSQHDVVARTPRDPSFKRENRDMAENSEKPDKSDKPKRPPFEKKQSNFGPPPRGGGKGNKGFGGPPKGRSRGPGRGR